MASEERTEMQSRLLLDVIIRKGPAVFKLLASKDQALLVGWNTLLVLNLRFHVVIGIRRFNFERNGLAGKSLHEVLHTATKTEDEVKSRLLLNVVIRQRVRRCWSGGILHLYHYLDHITSAEERRTTHPSLS
jgi:hypothetical protein